MMDLNGGGGAAEEREEEEEQDHIHCYEHVPAE